MGWSKRRGIHRGGFRAGFRVGCFFWGVGGGLLILGGVILFGVTFGLGFKTLVYWMSYREEGVWQTPGRGVGGRGGWRGGGMVVRLRRRMREGVF